MQEQHWQLPQALDAVIFDCDSTLSGVEGINVMAQENGVFQAVYDLTERAMALTGLDPALYQARLDLVRPRAEQMARVTEAYWQNLTPDVAAVIDSLHAMGKAVYVVSAGLQIPVAEFAARLHIPAARVYAVEVYFDEQGNYQDFDRDSPLAGAHGKSVIVNELKRQHPQIAHIGDGMNDLEAAQLVSRFVGYGGVCYRPAIASKSPYYIRSMSLAPVLPLLLTRREARHLPTSHQSLYSKGLELLATEVEFRQVE